MAQTDARPGGSSTVAARTDSVDTVDLDALAALVVRMLLNATRIERERLGLYSETRP